MIKERLILAHDLDGWRLVANNVATKGGFFSKSVMKFFLISKSPKKDIPKNYPELEI